MFCALLYFYCAVSYLFYYLPYNYLRVCSQGKGTFGVTRSFIATKSGLFRWHEHQQTEEITNEP